jgi:hypothetical protein
MAEGSVSAPDPLFKPLEEPDAHRVCADQARDLVGVVK